MKNKLVKSLVVMMVLASSMLWVGYASKRDVWNVAAISSKRYLRIYEQCRQCGTASTILKRRRYAGCAAGVMDMER